MGIRINLRLVEGIGADGLSGEVDKNGPSGPSGGSPYSELEPNQRQPILNFKQGQRIRVNIPGHALHHWEGRFENYHQHLSSPCEVILDRDIGRGGEGPESFWEASEIEPLEEALEGKHAELKRLKDLHDVVKGHPARKSDHEPDASVRNYVRQHASLINGTVNFVRKQKSMIASDRIRGLSRSKGSEGDLLKAHSALIRLNSEFGNDRWEDNKLDESGGDVLAYSGSGPLTFQLASEPLPWNQQTSKKPKKVIESEGFFQGHPTDATLTGLIRIQVLDNTNLRVYSPLRIFENLEAYKFFEQFQFYLPRTPMLNANTMDSIARWWRNLAERGDLLEIDCTTGYAAVTTSNNNVYTLGCLGTAPTSPVIPGLV